MDALYLDIGGTHLRAGRYSDNGPVNITKSCIQDYESIYRVLEDNATEDMSILIASTGHQNANGDWKITNGNGWTISLKELNKSRYSIKTIINDLEAACWALPSLANKDIAPLLVPPANSIPFNQNKSLIGIGTGLGLSYFYDTPGKKPLIRPSCGGHMVAASVTREHFEICEKISTYTLKPTIFENIVSGSGLLYLYQAVTGKVCKHPEEALDNENVYRLFHEFLGVFIHQATLYGDSFGGVYLTGGVVDSLVKDDRLDFATIARFIKLPGVDIINGFFDALPVYHIQNSYITLQGLHEKFVSDH